MNHSRAKEIVCVVFGHDWAETGHTKCGLHDKVYAQYETCSDCGLTKHIGEKHCSLCYDAMVSKLKKTKEWTI